MATPGRRGFYSSFQYVTLISGQLFAAFVLVDPAVLPADAAAAFRQLGMAHSVLYRRAGGRHRFVASSAPLRDRTRSCTRRTSRLKRAVSAFLLKHPREVGIVAGMTMGGTVAFYTYSAYMQKYLVTTVGMTREQSTIISIGHAVRVRAACSR